MIAQGEQLMKITDQQIAQMISSYLLRNTNLLFSLQQVAQACPVPVRHNPVAKPQDQGE